MGLTTSKASGGDGIPVELFQILKDDAVKGLYSICQQIWKTQQWPQDWKRSVFIPLPKKGSGKECSNYCTIAFCHMLAVMSNSLWPLEFSRPEYWSGLPFPSPGDLPNTGIEPRSPALHVDSLLTELWGTHVHPWLIHVNVWWKPTTLWSN